MTQTDTKVLKSWKIQNFTARSCLIHIKMNLNLLRIHVMMIVFRDSLHLMYNYYLATKVVFNKLIVIHRMELIFYEWTEIDSISVTQFDKPPTVDIKKSSANFSLNQPLVVNCL